jgi:hypothetical protein
MNKKFNQISLFVQNCFVRGRLEDGAILRRCTALDLHWYAVPSLSLSALRSAHLLSEFQ